MSESFDPDIQPADLSCPKCGYEMVSRTCTAFGCEDGYRDLYEDDPLWYDPDEFEECSECEGHGHYVWCQQCGWDHLTNRYIGWPVTKYQPQGIAA